jgi:nicotinamidase-related amidase
MDWCDNAWSSKWTEFYSDLFWINLIKNNRSKQLNKNSASMKQIILSLTIYFLTINLGYSQQNQLKQNMQTALVLIDIQNDYFDNGTMTLVGSDKASENARLLLDRFRADSSTIIHIQHIATRPTASFFLPNTRGADIHDNIKPLAQEKVIVKHYPNSFRETELLDYLKDKNITDLVICGMMTHMCVDATVRAAKDFGFNIVLIGDACTTKDQEISGQIVNAEDVQKSFLAALSHFYSTVQTSKQYLEGK